MANFLIQHYLAVAADKYPEKTAIVDGHRSVSFKRLDGLSDLAAASLLHRGFKQGETVGVYLPKSIEAVAAFFGILKAGGVYVPLDAHFSPADRIRRIIDISKTDYFFSSESLWNRLKMNGNNGTVGGLEDKKVVYSEGIVETGAGDASLPPLRPAGDGTAFSDRGSVPSPQAASAGRPGITRNMTEDDLAYILFTSGSTGIPKGVMITHRNAMTFIDWAIATFSPSPGTVFANHAPFHFDLSVFDIYVSIATGGELHIVPPEIMNNPRGLVAWIGDHGIEIWYSVPSVWIAALNYAQVDSRKLERLKTILFAGEVFPPKFLKFLMHALPGRRYYNLYGPTETNVCTYRRIESIDEIGDDDVPIGKACDTTAVAAFDEHLREVSVGETGELHVSGPGVAVGYFNNDEKTREAFIRIPAGPRGNRLWYATGDIVRRISAEEYRYVGRKDLMVKCAGFRVELQEIERVLLMHPVIREAAVVPRYREERGSVSLHAFVSFKPGARATISDLKRCCDKSLPRYMIPEHVDILDELPKNPNGKIDRNLLLTAGAPNKGN